MIVCHRALKEDFDQPCYLLIFSVYVYVYSGLVKQATHLKRLAHVRYTEIDKSLYKYTFHSLKSGRRGAISTQCHKVIFVVCINFL